MLARSRYKFTCNSCVPRSISLSALSREIRAGPVLTRTSEGKKSERGSAEPPLC
jgi:hypothetical protein